MASHRYTCVGFSPKADRKSIEFLRPMPCQRLCSVCSVLADVAFSLGCHHVFCVACMNDLLLNSTVAVCPFDDKTFRNVSMSCDSASEGYVTACQSYCLNRAFGCGYVGRMSEMIEHYYSECDYHVVYCGACAKPVARVNVLAHLRDGCAGGVLSLGNALTSSTVSGGRSAASDEEECLSAALRIIETFKTTTSDRTEREIDERALGSSDVDSGLPSDVETIATVGSWHDGTTDDSTQTEQEWSSFESTVSSVHSDDLLTQSSDGDRPAQESPVQSSVPVPHANGSNDSQDSVQPVESYSSVETVPEPITQPLVTFDWVVKDFRKYRNPPWPEFKSDVVTVGDNGYKLRLEGKFKFVNCPMRFLALYMRIQKGPDDASLEWPFRHRCCFLLMHTWNQQRDMKFRLDDLMDVDKIPRAATARLSRPKTAENFAVGIDQCMAVNQMVE
ncbi:hypothetical protein V5799_012412, partial [Amblyomma americanum]